MPRWAQRTLRTFIYIEKVTIFASLQGGMQFGFEATNLDRGKVPACFEHYLKLESMPIHPRRLGSECCEIGAQKMLNLSSLPEFT